MKHVITALVENKPGVLARIIALISGRGYNIDSLNVAPTQDSTESRLTMTVPGDDSVIEQITKQLNKLVDVVKVNDLTAKKFFDRELLLIEVAVSSSKRAELVELCGLFGATVVSVQPKSLTVQLTGDESKIGDFLNLLKSFKILDLSRTGLIAVAKGE